MVFGSRARDGARPDSDIDVLYALRSGRRLGWEIEQLADELAELFGRPVDLVSLRALNPLLRPSVLAEAQPVYAKRTFMSLTRDGVGTRLVRKIIGRKRL